MEAVSENPLEIRFFFQHGAAKAILDSMVIAIGTLVASMSATKRHGDATSGGRDGGAVSKKIKVSQSGGGKAPPISVKETTEDHKVELDRAKVRFLPEMMSKTIICKDEV